MKVHVDENWEYTTAPTLTESKKKRKRKKHTTNSTGRLVGGIGFFPNPIAGITRFNQAMGTDLDKELEQGKPDTTGESSGEVEADGGETAGGGEVSGTGLGESIKKVSKPLVVEELTPEAKMRLFDRGLRKENVKACGDVKLRTYWHICDYYDFTSALTKIEAEMAARGMPIPPRSRHSMASTDISSIKTTFDKSQLEFATGMHIYKLNDSDMAELKDIFENDITMRTSLNSLLACLLFAISFDKFNLTQLIKKELLDKKGLSTEEIKQAVKDIIDNPGILDRLHEVEAKASMRESLDSNTLTEAKYTDNPYLTRALWKFRQDPKAAGIVVSVEYNGKDAEVNRVFHNDKELNKIIKDVDIDLPGHGNFFTIHGRGQADKYDQFKSGHQEPVYSVDMLNQARSNNKKIADAINLEYDAAMDKLGRPYLKAPNELNKARKNIIGESLTEAKRVTKRYYVRPQNIFCANKEDILRALVEVGDKNCSVYSLKALDDHDDVHLLSPKDIIYYYDDGVLYDKNHVKVMDYNLFVKNEEERRKFGNADQVSDAVFDKEYEDRLTEDTNVFNLDFESFNLLGESVERPTGICCICGEEFEGYGNNPSPYMDHGRCCNACNMHYVIPARLELAGFSVKDNK